MWNKEINSVFLNSFTAKLLITGVFILQAGTAQALTAEDVLNKMDGKERASFIAGVVGGFAYSRYLRDKPDQTGMTCIYDWYYDSGETKWNTIETWFSQHPDKPAEPLVYVLIKKKCGE